MKCLLIIACLMALLNCRVSAQLKIATKDASKHMGESVTISDMVYDSKSIEGSETILLSLGGTYPNQLLTVLVRSIEGNKSGDKPEIYFKGQNVCLTGKVINHNGKPEIIVNSPSQLKINLSDNTVL